jgi:hypothetical protein
MKLAQYKTVWRMFAATLALAVTLGFTSTPAVAASKEPEKVSSAEFNKTMRKLWEDHITWTRLYIVSAAGNLPDKDATAQRLLQNQADIGNAISGFYGDAAGAKLTALLKDHILGAAALIEAAKSGDKAKTDAAAAKWYANADEIAAFLSGANPKNWPLADMKAGMKMHLDLTLAEATDQLQGKYAAGVQEYDKIHAHILGLADLLSSGIEKQFPHKFSNN